MRVEATKHDRPGRKSPGCPAAVFAAEGTIWGVSKLGGRNIKEYLQPRNTGLREVVIRGTEAGRRPNLSLGKADDIVEETGESTRCDRRGTGSSIQGKILGDNVGKVRRAAGTGDNLRRLLQRGKTEVEESPLRLANESVIAKKEE